MVKTWDVAFEQNRAHCDQTNYSNDELGVGSRKLWVFGKIIKQHENWKFFKKYVILEAFFVTEVNKSLYGAKVNASIFIYKLKLKMNSESNWL